MKTDVLISAGDRFGRLEVVSPILSHRKYYCLVKCDCGKQKEAYIYSLLKGAIKSCGCLNAEICKRKFTKHGLSFSRTHNSWCAMKARCSNPNIKEYKHYGARGISYDPAWESFENFYADMGECPDGLSIDRIDNNKGYYKENCRWATTLEQLRNRSICRVHSFFGEKITVTEAVEKYRAMGYDIPNPKVIYTRISKGWNAETALVHPFQKHQSRKRKRDILTEIFG
jgi:hypothetical protein